MPKIVSIHSFRGGTGKSNTTANVAALLAADGKRVGVIDTDILSPGIHVLFGLSEDKIKYALNDYLWGRCKIEETAYKVEGAGEIYLIPSSIKIGEITRILREGYDSGLLNQGFQDLIEKLNLDVLLIDTHPGVTLFLWADAHDVARGIYCSVGYEEIEVLQSVFRPPNVGPN